MMARQEQQKEREAVENGPEDDGETGATGEGEEAADGGHEGDGKTELPSCKIWACKIWHVIWQYGM